MTSINTIYNSYQNKLLPGFISEAISVHIFNITYRILWLVLA